MKSVAVHQPNYLPWLGYFYKISKVDLFVIQDNVDFESGNAESLTNRTRLKSPQGMIKLTVPVRHKTGLKKINQIQIDTNQKWARKHLSLITNACIHSPFFKLYFPRLESVLLSDFENLSDLNIALISLCCSCLEISTPCILASELKISGLQKSEQLVEICRQLDADLYLSGNGARKYNDPALFQKNNIALKYSSYKPPVYKQLFDGFIPGLSVLDALFNLGPQTKDLLHNEESSDSGL